MFQIISLLFRYRIICDIYTYSEDNSPSYVSFLWSFGCCSPRCCAGAGPPTPGLVQVMLTVDGSQDMAVHWESVHGADRYLALSTTGQNCTSSDSYCVISPLSCGQNHSISVTALNRAGPSSLSQPEDFLTCKYKNVPLLNYVRILMHYN